MEMVTEEQSSGRKALTVIDRRALPVTPGSTVDGALGDGEDFELLLAVAPERVDDLLSAWHAEFPGLPLTVIGSLVEPSAGEDLIGGWEHFGTSHEVPSAEPT